MRSGCGEEWGSQAPRVRLGNEPGEVWCSGTEGIIRSLGGLCILWVQVASRHVTHFEPSFMDPIEFR